MNLQAHSDVLGAARQEVIVTTLVEWIPLSIGMKLRQWFYRKLFSHFGQAVLIEPDVEFNQTARIALGDRVNLSRGVRLDNSGQNNRICLGAQVRVQRDAELTSSGQNNKIWIECRARLGWGVRLASAGQDSQIKIGEHVCLDRGVDIKAHDQGVIEIGAETYIGPYTCITGPGPVKIGRDCLIASHSSIYATNHRFEDSTQKIREQGIVSKGIVIGDDCWLGSGVRVLDGVTIHDGCVIGAGAVVTKDIPPYSVAVGVPAKVIGQRQDLSAPEVAAIAGVPALALAQDAKH